MDCLWIWNFSAIYRLSYSLALQLRRGKIVPGIAVERDCDVKLWPATDLVEHWQSKNSPCSGNSQLHDSARKINFCCLRSFLPLLSNVESQDFFPPQIFDDLKDFDE